MLYALCLINSAIRNLQSICLSSRWRTIAEKEKRGKKKGSTSFPHSTSLGKSLKESHYGLMECPSAFKINEMACVGERLQHSSINAFRQQAAVFCRYQLVRIRCKNKSRDLDTAQAVTGIELADCLQLSLQSVIRLQGGVKLPFSVAFQGI
jgi:hypothetical protein